MDRNLTPAYLRHRAGFEKALDPRLFTIEWLDAQVETGAVELFADDDGAILARLITAPTGAVVLEGSYATGTVEAIERLRVQVEAWGVAGGASFSTISSRRAWAKLLPEYEEYKVTFLKDLRNG